MFRSLVLGLAALALVVGGIVAEEYKGKLAKVDASAKKITIETKDGEKTFGYAEGLKVKVKGKDGDKERELSGGETPTSSAVQYWPPRLSTARPKASNSSGVFWLRLSPMITALPPPKSRSAMAFLYDMPRDRRRASRSEEHTSELQSH